MSISRTTDVARHLARKPHAISALRPEIVSPKDVAPTDLQILTRDLDDAVGSARNTDLPWAIQ
jgi:hypothetical protein